MWLDSVLRVSPLQTIFQRRSEDCLAVLAYHDINDPATFEAHIQYLLAHKMHPVSSEEVIRALESRQSLPKRACLVTFDDGYRSVLDVAAPILAKYGVPGIVFVITQFIGTQTAFWWDETKWLIQHGATVPGLENLDADEAVRQLRRMPDHARQDLLVKLRQSVPREAFFAATTAP